MGNGQVTCNQFRRLDFQPPSVEPPSQQLTVDSKTIEAVGSRGGSYRELWARVGSSDEKDFVALELQSEEPEPKVKRTGLWLFCGRRFARILGTQRGHGVVAGTCCQSLAQMQRLRGSADARQELREYYEASYGVV